MLPRTTWLSRLSRAALACALTTACSCLDTPANSAGGEISAGAIQPAAEELSPGAGATQPAAAGSSATAASGEGRGAGSADVCPDAITRTIRVAKDGSGDFSSVQRAIDSIANGSSEAIRIDIGAGTYNEKISIANRSHLCLLGENAATTILSYGDSNAKVGSTSGSASVFISANDFSAANLSFQNTYGSGSQAVALRATGERQQFLGCRFIGYQDTLYTHKGTQYFRNCYVQGNTDYVFGGATAVLDNCEVRNVEGGSAVAAPNTDASTPTGIVFLGGKFTAAGSVKANSVGLGRPWGARGAAAYLHVSLGSHILAAGFVAMSGNQPGDARFAEYASTGSGANASSRASYQMTESEAARYSVAKIFGSWVPSYSR